MKRFWLSWHANDEDYRPIKFPVDKAILGYWCSGYGDNYSTMCGLLECESETQCVLLISTYWPEFNGEWRIFSEKPLDWVPGDRFPMETK